MSLFGDALLRYFTKSLDSSPLPDEERCLARRYPAFSCHACRDSCPAGAISTDLRKHAGECRSCGLCAVSCALSAWEFDYDVNTLWHTFRRNRDKEEALRFCCRQTEKYVYPASIKVHCLVSLELPVLLLPALLGYREVWLHTEQCTDCPVEEGGKLDARVSHTAGLAEILAAAADLSIRFTRSATPPPVFAGRQGQGTAYSRRDFLTLLRQETKYTAKSGIAAIGDFFLNEEEEGEINRRTLWQKLLQCFPGMLNAGEALPFARAEVLPSCDLCRACSVLCPCQALGIRENDSEAMLVHYPVRCVSCGVCRFFCPNKAITLFPWEGNDWGERILCSLARNTSMDESV